MNNKNIFSNTAFLRDMIELISENVTDRDEKKAIFEELPSLFENYLDEVNLNVLIGLDDTFDELYEE